MPFNSNSTEYKINRKVTRVGTFEVYVPTHVALRMFHYACFITHVYYAGSGQLHFLAKRNAGIAIPPLLWPVNCIKIGKHVVLLSGPTVHSLFCGQRPDLFSKYENL